MKPLIFHVDEVKKNLFTFPSSTYLYIQVYISLDTVISHLFYQSSVSLQWFKKCSQSGTPPGHNEKAIEMYWFLTRITVQFLVQHPEGLVSEKE